MSTTKLRLVFVDVIRAFAICMMLQGHFIDGLLANEFRDESNVFFATWLYFRGITAPVFFSISGFIFMYLLAKEYHSDKVGWKHVRVRKGIERGITLIIVAYLLRTNIFNLFSDQMDWNVRAVDVLQCIGLSLLFLIAIYLFSYKKKRWVMPAILFVFSFILFLFAPVYKHLTYDYLWVWVANYFTKTNGSVFTIFPWFAYTGFGAFMGTMFNLYKNDEKIYQKSMLICLLFGLLLLFGTSSFFLYLYEVTNWQLFLLSSEKDYVFQRLGNVLLIFSFFILMRNVITLEIIQKIGQNTLSIYIIHYIILYGSLTGLGLYRYFHHQLTPLQAIFGAISFVIVNIFLSFQYNKYKPLVSEKLAKILKNKKDK